MSNNNNQEEKDADEKEEEVRVPVQEVFEKDAAEDLAPRPSPNGHQCQAMNRSIFLSSTVSPAAERIRFILGEEDDGPAPPQLFTELDELLSVDGQEMEWKETAR